MARVLLKNGKGMPLTKDQGASVWRVLQGEEEPTEEQNAFINQIDRIWLSFDNAPDSYIKQNLELFKEWCRADWLVDYQGRPVKPQNNDQWTLAKRYNFAPKA